jgi:hypothetical protein
MEGRQVRCSVCGADFVVPSASGIDSGGSCDSIGVEAGIVGTYDERFLDSALFAKSSKEEVRNLNLKITELSFGEGEIIFEEGDEGSHLYLVLEGRYEYPNRGEAVIRRRCLFNPPVIFSVKCLYWMVEIGQPGRLLIPM